MNEKIGLVNEQVRLVRKDDELIDRVMKARDISEEDKESIKDMLRYNMWTIKQLGDITGLNKSTILNKTRPIYRNGDLNTELDFCYPFSNLEGQGPKFIIRNEKSEVLLS